MKMVFNYLSSDKSIWRGGGGLAFGLGIFADQVLFHHQRTF